MFGIKIDTKTVKMRGNVQVGILYELNLSKISEWLYEKVRVSAHENDGLAL